MPPSPSFTTLLRRPAAAIAAGAALVGFVVLLGWWTTTTGLSHWGGRAGSAPWSAFWLVTAPLAAVAPKVWRRRLAGLAAAAGLLALAAPSAALLLQQLAFPATTYVSSPGTCLVIILLAAAATTVELRWWPTALAVAAASVANLTLLGHLLGRSWLTSGGASDPLAGLSLPTVALALLGATVVVVESNRHNRGADLLEQDDKRMTMRRIAIGTTIAAALTMLASPALSGAGVGRTAYLAVVGIALAAAMFGTLIALAADRREAAAALETMVDAAPDATIFCDPDGLVVRMNTQAERLFGWTRDELLGQSVDLLLPESHRAAHEHHRAAYGAQPDYRQMSGRELDARRRDGETFPAEVSLAPLRIRGRLVVAATVRDVTPHREQVERLRELDEMKNLFLSAVSHELRTPLTFVKSMTQLLIQQDDAIDPTRRRELMGRIVRNADHLDSLLGDLLDIERLRRGDIVHDQTRPTNVTAVARATALNFAQDFEHEIKVAASVDLWALATPSLLERVVSNLLTNAAKYAPDTPIEVTVERVNADVVIRVDDHGPGIEPEQRQSIFHPFDRGRETGSATPGIGIGLTLVRQFTAWFGGEAWVDPRDDGTTGASFRIRLPALAASPDALAGTDQAPTT